MTITLPEEMRGELLARANADGYATVEDYVQSLVTSDLGLAAEGESFSPELRERLCALAEEGLRSPPIDNPAQFLSDLVHEASAGGDLRTGSP